MRCLTIAVAAVPLLLATGCAPSARPDAASASTSALPGRAAPTTRTTSPTAAPLMQDVPASAAAAGTDNGRGQVALRILSGLQVRGRGPMTGYSREQFGQAWADIDRNGCDTRSDMLKRDLTGLVFKAGTRDCAVLRGSLRDPYTATTVEFIRGGTSEVDVDHVVALGNAWVSGAARLAPDARAALANDPLNLLTVTAATNRAKGDGDAASWLPPNEAVRCAYVARQVAVKAKYSLSVTAAESATINAVLTRCPAQLAPTGGSSVLAPGFGAKPTARPPPRATPSELPLGGVDRGSCAAAIAADGGNYRRGVDPEYGFYKDADLDGTVCEGQ